ncbi:MAG: alpha-2-macroglobulin family protein [Planctomycetales bacterium]
MSPFLIAAEQTVDRGPRGDSQRAFLAGNFQVAFEGFRKLALDPKADQRLVGSDLEQGIAALQNLGRGDEVDEFRDAVIEVQRGTWRLLRTAARSFVQGEHHGFVVAGKFHRGARRGGTGQFVDCQRRDRVRTLQLMQQALPLALQDDDRSAVAEFHLEFAQALLAGAGHSDAWRLQELTNLEQLPDLEEGRVWRGMGTEPAAPVDADGHPVLHSVPKSYEAARSDGERWRWMLAQAAEIDPTRGNEAQLALADFLHGQFGVQTMAIRHWGMGLSDEANGESEPQESGTYAVQTLEEGETIARLATGIRRFKLPDEFNPIRIYQAIAQRGKSPPGERSLESLCQIFEDRRQYVKAAEMWRWVIAEYGAGENQHREQRLNQIVAPWGRFDLARMQAAGKGATLDFRFRNGKKVAFAAWEIKLDLLLKNAKDYLQSNPGQLDGNRLNISNFGYRLVTQNEQAYLGNRVATWDLELQPRPAHLDDRVTVTTPLQKPGAYLVTAKLEGGNVSRIIVWVADTVIAKKQLAGQAYLYVADAVTGRPIPKANVEFLGWKQTQVNPNQNIFRVVTTNFAEFTDNDGQVLLNEKKLPQDYQWLITARTGQGRLAYLGFTGIWYPAAVDEAQQEAKVFTITDRPVYRPRQTVKFKFWVGESRFDQPEESRFANQQFTVQIHDPKGEKVFEQKYLSDAYGGLDGEFPLAKDAALGVYHVQIVDRGGGSFRVEEYKKPEYEVLIESPSEPIVLGKKFTATISARYYFGGPVSNARVKYKVLRTNHSGVWHPPGPWDWLYGRGYGWFAADFTWYPGWRHWGCLRPVPFWWGRPQQPPEVISEVETTIDDDGVLRVEIDTLAAKELHGTSDHQYAITAEVTDQSRRSIVGTGSALAARKPFQVVAWVDRGHYRAGDAIEAHVQAHTLDQKPVQGRGELTLYQITYDPKQQPVEKVVETWKLDTDAQGQAHQTIQGARSGQFRLSYKLTDAKARTIEGGYLFVVTGNGFDGHEYRFNDLELVTDKREYAPGESVKLLINTNRAGGAVVLFLRPANGVYFPPRVLRLDGKSTILEVPVLPKDMPNFFVEALSIANGRLHTETREVLVPPEKRLLNVEVLPSQTEYKPGAEARMKVRVTDLAGRPFVGSTVVTIYDKSVEYIAGGSNIPEIREFFWKWRRQHHPQTESTLDRLFDNLLRPGELPMANLGVFGDAVIEEGLAASGLNAMRHGAMPEGMMLGGGGRGAMPMVAAMEADFSGLASVPGEGGAELIVTPAIRREFADTAYWAAALVTDRDGLAEVSLQMPENLTGWKVKVWILGAGTRVGQGDAEVTTKKNLLVRMQAPRFFVEKDEVVLSANVHNDLASAKEVQVKLEVDGETLSISGNATQTVRIESHAQCRVDWRVKVAREGEAVVRMQALTNEESDAMELRFPVYVHGLQRSEAYSGVIRPDKDHAQVTLMVPAERRISDSRLEVRFSPTLAGAMVDALPYLVEYPYGCTEQTLNRFLPTVITQNVLLRMQINLQDIRDKRTNLNPQELGDDRERARQWQRFQRQPVFDEVEVRQMAADGLRALTAMQLRDGGWGWFSGHGEQSWPHTTALVVHGLQVARQNDVALVPGVLERGVEWLANYQARQVQLLRQAADKKSHKEWKVQADNLDAFVYMVLQEADVPGGDMRDFLYRDRNHLTVYGKALLGLALHRQNEADKLAMILENIEQFLVQDDENQTAWLKLPEGNSWWLWHGDEIEAHAWYLKLLAKTDPRSEKVSRLVKYLLNNRKHATYWNSTRDTAFCIEALADYLRASGEDQPDMTLEVWLDGKRHKEVRIDPSNLWTFDNQFTLIGDAVESGRHTLELRRRGVGPVYFNAYLSTFTLEDFITRAGLEVKVNRKYFRLTRADKAESVVGDKGQAVRQKVEKYERTELPNLASLKSGDLVEIELELDSKNDYEYLIFEDMKAAGFEPLELRSGYSGNGLGAYMELRDERVCFFIRSLPRGKHSLAYRMRAEIPGRYSALPTRGSAMYAPELRGNSDELKLVIEE